MKGRQLAGWRFIEPDANRRTSDCEVRKGPQRQKLLLEVPINLGLRPTIKETLSNAGAADGLAMRA